MKEVWRRWSRAAIDVRAGEGRTVALMMAYGFLTLSSYYIVKPVRNSVFVARVGTDQLPLVYIVTAVVVIGLMVVYSRRVDRVGHLRLLLGSIAVLAATLVGFWAVLRDDTSGYWVSGAFYVFGKLYPLILVSQFWLVANILFSTAQARRLFGPIGVGPILGGIFGSAIAGFMAAVVGSENLLLLAAAMIGGCAVIVGTLSPAIERGATKSGRLTGEVSGTAWDLLRRSDHLRTIALILGITTVVGTLLDWQFNRAVELFIEGEDAKTLFFGRFFGALNVAALVVQVLLTGLVLRRFGLQVALLALPVGLLIGTAGILAGPALLAVSLAKGAEGTLRHSLDQATRELLFLPVPLHVKYKVKPLIDLGIYRGGTGVGGILLVLGVNGLGFTLIHVAWVTLGLIGLWIWAALRMKREFGRSMLRLIDIQDVKLEELVVSHLNAETLDRLRHTLHTGNEDQISYALALLRHAPPQTIASDVARLVKHESSRVRRRAVAILADLGQRGFADEVEPLLSDPDLDVRAEAVRYTCEYGSDDPPSRMREFLAEGSPVRTAAVGCLLRYGDRQGQQGALETVRRLMDSDAPEDRRMAAHILGRVDHLQPEMVELLVTLLQDDEVAVCQEAMKAAGATRVPEMLPQLLDRLADPRYRKAASGALREFGRDAHPALLERLEDPESPQALRATIPRVMLPELQQDTVDRLLELADSLGAIPRFEILKALNKARRRRPDLRFDRWDPEALVLEEVDLAYRYVALRADIDDGGILGYALEQREREAVERAFRALGLQLPAEDLYAAHEALTSRDGLTRQRGFELLDSVLPLRYRRVFDPLLNPDAEPHRVVEEARDRSGEEAAGREEALTRVLIGYDPWLCALARHTMGVGAAKTVPWSPSAFQDYMWATSVLAEETVIPCEERAVMDIVERAEILRDAKIFSGLRSEDLAGIATLVDECDFEDGEVVFDEGEEGQKLFVVVDGRIQATRDGRPLFAADRGRSVGSLSLLDGLPTNYRASAVGPTRALVLTRRAFSIVLEERTRVAESVIRYLTGVVRELNAGSQGESADSVRRSDADP